MLSDTHKNIVQRTKLYVQQKLAQDYSGHDIAHIERVVKLAQHIQVTLPHSNVFIVIMSAYLHDVIDDKVIDNSQQAHDELNQFLQQQNLLTSERQAILAIIENISFCKNLFTKQPLSLEGQIVQDADRLDALGAIGVGRTFYYGGNKKNIMHDPTITPRINMTEADYRKPNTVINHFYEKLLLLKDQMNTVEGKKIALKRHQFLLEFIKQFEDEWQGYLE